MTERDRAAGRLLLERGLANSDALRRCAQLTQERRGRGEQVEVLQVLVELGALDRTTASTLWRDLQAGAPAQGPPPTGRLAPPPSGHMAQPPPSGRMPQMAPPTASWGPGAPTPGAPPATVRGNFNDIDSTPTIGPAGLAEAMGPPPSAGFGPPPSAGFGPPPTAGFGPPPTAGFGPPPNAGYGPPPTAGYGPPQQFNAGPPGYPGGGPPPAGLGGPAPFNPAPGGAGFNTPGAPPQPGFAPPGFDPDAPTLRGALPPVQETGRSPGGLASPEDLAGTVKGPPPLGPPGFQSDFDPTGSGFGPSSPPAVQAPPPSPGFAPSPGEAGFSPPPAQAGVADPDPPSQVQTQVQTKVAGQSSRSRKGKSPAKKRGVSARTRAGRAKREKKPPIALLAGAGVLVLAIVIGIAVVFSSDSDPKQPTPTPSATETPEESRPPKERPRDPPPKRSPKPTPQASAVGAADNPIPKRFRTQRDGALANDVAEEVATSLITRCADLVEESRYEDSVEIAQRSLKYWPEWLEGTEGQREVKGQLKLRRRQAKFAARLAKAAKTPRSPEVTRLINAIANNKLPDDFDLPCVPLFTKTVIEAIGEQEYEAILVKEFDLGELTFED